MPPVNQGKGEITRKNTGGDVENTNGGLLPGNFEKFMQDNKTLLMNDPLREILLYPQDDVTCSVLPRRWRTVTTTVPDVRSAATCPLLTRQSLLSYASSWNLVHYKYAQYSGSALNLPGSTEYKIPEEVYNLDAELEEDNEITQPKTDTRTKEGYLFKGPEIGSERMFSNLASKTFKKRYCSLVKESNGTYILEVFKDDKKTDVKLTIVMDYCSEVVKNPKRGRFCIEIRMAGGSKGYSFSAESEDEYNEWFSALLGAVKRIDNGDSPQTDEVSEKESDSALTPEPPPPQFGTLKGLELSMNPLLMRYSRESDLSIAAARAEARSHIFSLPYQRGPDVEPHLEPFKEHFGQRILLKCESLKFRLQAPIDGDKELLCQLEPYFTRLALYDSRAGRKISEDFHFDLNHEDVMDLVKEEEFSAGLVENFCIDVKLDTKKLSDEWFKAKRQVLMSINNPHPDIFIVVRIDKILQGNVTQVSEPYLRATKDPKLGLKVHKAIRAYANRVGTYRMPFAWSAKPLFRLYSNELDTCGNFPALYRQEPGKTSDEDMLKILTDYRKPEKVAKLTVVPGWLSVSIQQQLESVPNSMTCSYAALKPFPLPPTSPLTVELATPGSEPEQPHAAYTHHLYVRPLSLNFDSQRVFARARNIACSVELRDNDSGDNKGLHVVYGRWGISSRGRCSLLHHNSSPAWCDEVKLRLPVTLTSAHHLLFIFHHISCDLAKKNDTNVETCIGYAWVPLLRNGKPVEDIVNLPVATHLPSGYLSIQPLGLGKGTSGPEVTWVESEKPLFHCQLVLDSTVMTRDPHLHNLFQQAERLLEAESQTGSPQAPPWTDVCNSLKAAHAIKLSSLVAFLPTILNQLFELMSLDRSYSSEMGYQIVKLIIHYVHMIHDYGRKDLLDSYVKYVFNCVRHKVHTVLTEPLYKFVDPTQQDFLLGHKFMQYSSFFFDIIVKSMAQYLINTGRIKMARSERFNRALCDHIEKLMSTVEPAYILQQPMQTHIFNKNLALFLKSCLSFMDRGFVFRQIQTYMDKYRACDPKALFEFKFTFLQTICSHEHYVTFNLPLQLSTSSRMRDDDYVKMKFTDDFVKRHFLAGTLLKQVDASLREAPQKRRTALGVFRALLTKHEHDERYARRQCRARVAQLYAPWLNRVLENSHRLIVKDASLPIITENGHDKVDGDGTLANPSINSIITNNKEVLSTSSTPRRNRLTLHFDQTPTRNSTHFKDPVASLNSMGGKGSQNSVSQISLESELSTMSGGDSLTRTITTLDLNEIGDQVNRFGVLSAEEARDVLLCFLFVLKYMEDDRLVNWWRSCSDAQLQSFFNVLEICAEHFQYLGRKRILSDMKISTPDSASRVKPMKARTLPARMTPPDFSKDPPIAVEKNNTVNRENLVSDNVASELDQMAEHTVLTAGSLATEVGLTIIDRVCLFTRHMGSAGSIAARPYVKLLRLPQSDTLYKHLFAALRAYINQFSETLFEGDSWLCGSIVSAVVRLCEARAPWLRREAAAALYLLMRANFQHADSKALTRVHLQVIIAVSKLMDDSTAINYSRFQESLSVINGFASGDKAMKGTGLSSEVAELMRRVRTVVGARCRLAEGGGGVHLAELQHALAASCRATPRLRHATLATLAEHHARHHDHTEAMCCQLHIAALIAEYLRARGSQSWGATAFADISLNIPRDETGIKIDQGSTEAQYSSNTLLQQLMRCAQYVEKAERYELLGPLYRLAIPELERQQDYTTLLQVYQHLTKAYSKVIEVSQSGKRLFGRFYRVAFFGNNFGEEDAGLEFVYKEPKLTSLSEVSLNLKSHYETKLGAGNVKIIMDSAPVNKSDLEPSMNYIQVTSLRALAEGGAAGAAGPAAAGEGVWHLAHNVHRFVYETPFTRDGGARGPVHHQCVRQTFLTTVDWFPYVKRRSLVVEMSSVERSPIEVALGEMETATRELQYLASAATPDLKRLQLRLQGSVCTQVNAGPLAYASAFLDPALAHMYPDEQVQQLKTVFKEFLTVCHSALQLNSKLISADQTSYHEALESNYAKLSESLASLLGEPIRQILVNGNLSATVSGVEMDSSNA